MMVDRIQQMYPHTKCIALGLSMGGNVILKYLGEDQRNQEKIVAAITVCTSYCINRWV